MPELFPCMDITDVYFQYRGFDSRNSVTQGNGSVGITTGIQQDTIIGKAYFMHMIDHFAFNIALKIGQLYIRILCFQFFEIRLKRLIPIDTWLPLSKEI